MEDGVDGKHVAAGGFERHRDGTFTADGGGEGFAFDGVLIASVEGLDRDSAAEDVASVVHEDTSRAIGRGVEGDFDFNAAAGAVELHALVGVGLGAAGELAVDVAKVEDGAGEAVRLEVGVAFDLGADAEGVAAGDEAGGEDGVAADVHDGAAGGIGFVADVGGVGIGVAEEALDGAELADFAFVDGGFHPEPLGVGGDHEGFADFDVRFIADGDERVDFGDVDTEGLFAEDMLAGAGGADGPFDVEVIGKGVVDDVDGGVGEEFVVGAVGGGDAEGGGVGLGGGEIAGADGGDFERFGAEEGGDDLGTGEFRGAQNAPAETSGHDQQHGRKRGCGVT